MTTKLNPMYAYVVLFLVVVITELIAGEGDDADPMSTDDAQIIGKYKLGITPMAEDYNDFLIAMKYSNESRQLMRKQFKKKVSISRKDAVWTVKVTIPDGPGIKTMEFSFESGQEFDAQLWDERKIKNTIVVDEKGKKATRILKVEGMEAKQEFVFSKTGFKVLMSARDKTATQYFQRTQ